MKPRYLLALIFVPLTVIAVVSTLAWAQCWALMPEIGTLMGIFHNVCPIASEEARYPADIDILVSSYDAPSSSLGGRVKLSVGGQNILYEPREEHDKYHLYTIATQQTTELVFPENVFYVGDFVTDELILVEYQVQTRTTSRRTWGLWNVTTAEVVALNDINTEKYLANGIPTDLHPLILSHPTVYVTHGDLLLVPTYPGDPDATATLIQGYMSRPYPEEREKLIANLRALGVEPISLDSLDSPDKAFRAEPPNFLTSPFTYRSSIVEVASGRTILTNALDFFEPIGWAEGQHGVVSVHEGCAYYVIVCVAAQPTVLQRQSAEFLTPAQQAAFAAQDAKEAAAKQQGQTVTLILLIASVALIGATLTTVLYHPRRETGVAANPAVA